MTRLAVAIAFLSLNFYTYNYLATDPVIPERNLFAEFPDSLGRWRCDERVVLDAKTLSNLGVTDYLLCNYQSSSDEIVGVYVGYHASQVREQGGGAGENSIHPPAHCLPGSGWDIIDNRIVMLDMDGMPTRPGPVKRLLIARGEARQLTYYWYQSRGRVVSADWKKVLYVGFDRATRSRTDGSLLRFTIPIYQGGEETAEKTFHDLAPRILDRISEYVPE